MSEGPNVALLVVASALAGAKLQDIVKHVLGRGRARHPVDASGPTRARSRDHDAPPRGSVDGARGVDAPSPALSPVRTITRKSIGSPQGVPPRARELALDAVVCARCDACPPLGSSPRSRAASLAAAAGVPARKPDPYLAVGRERYLSWDDYFMSVAFLSAQRSKDPNKQVGAVIVGPERVICGVGYNGFPRGCSDSDLPWAKKSARGDPMETKYAYVCHAEVRASDGASVAGGVARAPSSSSSPGFELTRASYPSRPLFRAQMNAIMNKNSQNLVGATLYVTMYPCNECAKLVIQSGIREVVYFEGKNVPEHAIRPSADGDADGDASANGDGDIPGDIPGVGVGNIPGDDSARETPTRGGVRPDPTYAAAGKLLALADVRVRQHTPSAVVSVAYD